MFANVFSNPDSGRRISCASKSGQLAELERGLPGGGDDDRLADEILNLMMYDGHPYGHPDLGMASSVKALSLDDVEEFYRQHFVPGEHHPGPGREFRPGAHVAGDGRFQGAPPRLDAPARSSRRSTAGGTRGRDRRKSGPCRFGPPRFPRSRSSGPIRIISPSGSPRRVWESRDCRSTGIREDGTVAGGSQFADAAIEHPAWGSNRFPRPNHVRRQQHFSVRLGRPEPGAGARAASGLLEAMRKLAAEGISDETVAGTRTRLLTEVRLYSRTLEEHLAWRMDSKLTGFLDFLDEVQYALPKVSREDVRRAARTHFDSRSVSWPS